MGLIARDFIIERICSALSQLLQALSIVSKKKFTIKKPLTTGNKKKKKLSNIKKTRRESPETSESLACPPASCHRCTTHMRPFPENRSCEDDPVPHPPVPIPLPYSLRPPLHLPYIPCSILNVTHLSAVEKVTTVGSTPPDGISSSRATTDEYFPAEAHASTAVVYVTMLGVSPSARSSARSSRAYRWGAGKAEEGGRGVGHVRH